MRTVLFFPSACAAAAADNSTLADRAGTTGFVQLEAESFNTLTLKEQRLAYRLHSELSAKFDAAGQVAAVTIHYPREYVKQQFGYGGLDGVQ